MSDRELVTRDEGHIRVLTINRPDRSNALSHRLWQDLTRAAVAASEDPDVWVVVLTAVGTRAFCAGGDLKEMQEDAGRDRPLASPWQGSTRMLFEILSEMPKPTIAGVNGTAVAGGFELMLCCDLRVASSEARFGLPEAKRGLGANWATVTLPRQIGSARAYELLYTGEYIPADTALEWGIINRVVAPDRVQDVTLDLARTVVANAPVTLRRIKEMTVKSASLPVSAAARLDVGPNPYLSTDRLEGVAAFVEGRAPSWQNR